MVLKVRIMQFASERGSYAPTFAQEDIFGVKSPSNPKSRVKKIFFLKGVPKNQNFEKNQKFLDHLRILKIIQIKFKIIFLLLNKDNKDFESPFKMS